MKANMKMNPLNRSLTLPTHTPTDPQPRHVIAVISTVLAIVALFWLVSVTPFASTTATSPQAATTPVASVSLSGALPAQLILPASDISLVRSADGIRIDLSEAAGVRIEVGSSQPGSYDLRGGTYGLTLTDTASGNRYNAFDGTVRISDSELHIAAWLRDASGQPLSLSARIPLSAVAN